VGDATEQVAHLMLLLPSACGRPQSNALLPSTPSLTVPSPALQKEFLRLVALHRKEWLVDTLLESANK